VRGAEHLSQFCNSREDSALFKHKQNDHKEEDMTFKMEITNKFETPSPGRPMKPSGYLVERRVKF
jgi:hypothetical protein